MPCAVRKEGTYRRKTFPPIRISAACGHTDRQGCCWILYHVWLKAASINRRVTPTFLYNNIIHATILHFYIPFTRTPHYSTDVTEGRFEIPLDHHAPRPACASSVQQTLLHLRGIRRRLCRNLWGCRHLPIVLPGGEVHLRDEANWGAKVVIGQGCNLLILPLRNSDSMDLAITCPWIRELWWLVLRIRWLRFPS